MTTQIEFLGCASETCGAQAFGLTGEATSRRPR
jgi:hypothetical protein